MINSEVIFGGLNMELSFSNGTFVANYNKLNYQAVIDDFQNASCIRILTYNISKDERYDALFEAIKDSNAEVDIVTNVPGRMEKYYQSPAGEAMRNKARDNIHTYIRKLNPENFPNTIHPFFNMDNHAKIIGTENVVYIGSANFSNESAQNIETGVIIRDKEFIEKLYTDFFDEVKGKSLSYNDEYFSAFRLLVLSLRAKFESHYKRILDTLYTEYQGNHVLKSDDIELNIDDLEKLYWDLDELDSLPAVAEDSYDDDESEYNAELSELCDKFSNLSIDWLKDTISEEGPLWDLLNFDREKYALEQLQNEYSSEAYDEYLEEYVQKSVDDANEVYDDLHDAFDVESADFITEIENILSILKEAEGFSVKWKPKRIAVGLDNT